MQINQGFIGGCGLVRNPIIPIPQSGINTLEGVLAVLTRPEIQDHLKAFVPSFFNDIEPYLSPNRPKSLNISHKTAITAYKFASRAMGRCTPFSTLSTMGAIEIELTGQFQLNVADDFQIDRRLDFGFIADLVQWILSHEAVRQNLKYCANDTLYLSGRKWRYYERVKDSSGGKFELSQFTDNKVIHRIINLCSDSFTSVPDIVVALDKECFTKEEIWSFLNELIDSGILVCELEPSLGSENQLGDILSILKKRLFDEGLIDKIIRPIEAIKSVLNDHSISISDGLEKVRLISNKIGVTLVSKDLFHIDAIRSFRDGLQVDQEKLNELAVLHDYLQSHQPQSWSPLENFKSKFFKRYGYQKVPLLVAIDSDAGIGYNEIGESLMSSPLVHGIQFGKPKSIEQSQTFSELELELFRVLGENPNLKSINLMDLRLSSGSLRPVPVTQSCLFSVLQNGQILFEEFSGSTAIAIAGRFNDAASGIAEYCRNIEKLEQETHSCSILCEVHHKGEHKSSNISARNLYRNAIINICSPASPDQGTSIPMDDILVSINDTGDIILSSKSLNKEIKPFISSSVNYSLRSIALFRFLGDLQFQNCESALFFDWYRLKSNFAHFPRVLFGSTVICPEIWVIENGITELNWLKTWIRENNVPRHVYVCQDIKIDRKLYVDTKSDLALQSLLQEQKGTTRLYVLEATQISSIVDNAGSKAYLNEIAIPFYSNSSTSLHSSQDSFSDNTRIDDKWVSTKLYCGNYVAQDLILDAIQPLIEQLQNLNCIDNWFFVRYSDEDYHLRLRFKLIQEDFRGEVIAKLQRACMPYIANYKVHRFEIDNYSPELDRYGATTMMSCESIFSANSDSVIDLTKTGLLEDYGWVYASLVLNTYFERIGLSIEDKFSICEKISNQFQQEFGIEKEQRIRLDLKYRERRPLLSAVLSNKPEDEIASHLIEVINDEMIRSEESWNELISRCSINTLMDITVSLIHMSCNRIFVFKPREQETVIYYLLSKHFRSVIGKQKRKQSA